MNNSLHIYRFKVLETHLDTFGHMNNATYLKIFEEARWEMITENGYGLNRIQETGLGPTILELNVKFRRELRLRQDVIIETQVTELRKKLATVQQVMKDSAGTACCVATFTFGLFDVQARKLVQATPAWLKALGADPAWRDLL
jgi:thioesterase-3